MYAPVIIECLQHSKLVAQWEGEECSCLCCYQHLIVHSENVQDYYTVVQGWLCTKEIIKNDKHTCFSMFITFVDVQSQHIKVWCTLWPHPSCPYNIEKFHTSCKFSVLIFVMYPSKGWYDQWDLFFLFLFCRLLMPGGFTKFYLLPFVYFIGFTDTLILDPKYSMQWSYGHTFGLEHTHQYA